MSLKKAWAIRAAKLASSNPVTNDFSFVQSLWRRVLITRVLGQLLLSLREFFCSSLSYEHSLMSVQRNPSECEQM